MERIRPVLTTAWTNAPMSYTIAPDSPQYVYLCPYCESIYDEYQSNCKNCGAPLQMKPIRRC